MSIHFNNSGSEESTEARKGGLLVKMDIKQAYHNISVAPEDRYLLGFQWEGRTYVDIRLPFGLQSVPFIFSSIADALLDYAEEWCHVGNPLPG